MPESNRIEVQLHLIANDDIDRLEKAFAAFSGSVGQMSKIGATGGGMATKLGTSHGLPSQMSPVDFEATTRARQSGMQAGVGMIGGIQTSKTGGLRSRISAISPRTLYDELPGSNPLQKIGYGLAFGPQALGTAKNLMGAFGGAAYGGGFTAAGVQTGATASNGLFGSGIGSSAFRQGAANIGAQFANPFDPFMGNAISIAQQQGWQATRGWAGSSPTANLVSKMLSAGVSGDEAGNWLEQMRYGGTNIAQLTKRVKELGDTARAAHMGLGNFNAQLSTAASAYSTMTGGSGAYATDQIMALSRGTGLTPGALQPMLANKTLQGVSIAMAGGDMASAVYGRNAGLNNLRALERMIAPQLGYRDFAAVAQALKNPQAKHQILNKLLWLYQGAPELFNGMTPNELLSMIQNTGGMGGVAAGFHAAQDMRGPTTNFNANKIAHELSSAGMSDQVSKIMSSSDWAGMSAKDKIEKLRGVQSDWMRNKTEDRATNKTSVVLTGYAEKVFKIASAQADIHPPHTSTSLQERFGQYGIPGR